MTPLSWCLVAIAICNAGSYLVVQPVRQFKHMVQRCLIYGVELQLLQSSLQVTQGLGKDIFGVIFGTTRTS